VRALRPGFPALRSAIGLVGLGLIAAGALHVPAMVVAVLAGETNDATAMLVGATAGAVLGLVLVPLRPRGERVTIGTATVVVASTWVVVPAVVAISLHLSGHTASLVDAYLDAMSGLTTSGLSVLQDLDHLGTGMQVLRHSLHFAGGQGIVLVVLTLLESAQGGLASLLGGEGREERLVPNVRRTARLIYVIAAAWLVAGTTVLTAVLLGHGLTLDRALLHGVTLFAAAFDTGGFSPMSTSVAYYHSGAVELVLSVLMVAGALSFPVHFALWRRRQAAVTRDEGVRTFVLTTTGLTVVMLVGLAAHGALTRPVDLLRTGAFTALSAATGTGFAVVPGSLVDTCVQLAPAAVVALMGIGAMAGSTAGGVKVERVATLARSIARDVRRALSPPDAVVLTTRTSRTGVTSVVDPATVRAAAVVTTLFLLAYVGGALVHVAYGATVEDAIFESVSATATVGLSVGVLRPDGPPLQAIAIILQMWLGRLEFIAAFALVGWGIAQVRGPGRSRHR
jgi:trk system potassium uptake protein TrkH